MRGFRQSGFSLLELMIVVAIIGMLAAIAVPNYVRARENARNSTFVSDLRVATDAFQEYSVLNGRYPDDQGPAVVPDGMSDYLTHLRWTEKNSLGGEWDWDYKVFGVTAGVSVYQPEASTKQLIRVDQLIDDGNLASGYFRQRNSGYIAVIE